MSETNIVTGCDGDDCLMCSGEACNLCGAGCWSNRKDCKHDVMERHEEPETTMTTTSPALAQQETLERCPLGHPEEKGLHVNSSSSMRKWHITCFDCGLYLEGTLDEPIRSLAERWNIRRGDKEGPTMKYVRIDAHEAGRDLMGDEKDMDAARTISIRYRHSLSREDQAALDGHIADALATVRAEAFKEIIELAQAIRPDGSIRIERERGEMAEQTEFAWLIEGDGVYWDGHHADRRGFISDVNKAIRFARREDADVVKYHLLEAFSFALKVTEHGWINGEHK